MREVCAPEDSGAGSDLRKPTPGGVTLAVVGRFSGVVLPFGTAVRTSGYYRDRVVEEDGDRCSTRSEVLITEAIEAPEVYDEAAATRFGDP
ncbi:hypothetical protein [Streptomyces sp. NPDC004134]|uniref:hypothetical protein n=1 Tax=Streptomyces sp. NPDC004134 TaxID=3364691 RepID=UPI003696FA77